MNSFETMIARYNSTLPTIGDGEGQELQLTARGILRVTPSDLDGTDMIFTDGDSVAGGTDRGFIAYGVDALDVVHPLKLDSQGNLNVNVQEGIISVDFTPGTENDEGSDEAGANTEPGVVGGITGTYQTVTSVTIPFGVRYALTAFDFTADQLAQFQLVYNTSNPAQYIRTTLLPENQGTNQIVFPRPKELQGDTGSSLVLRAKCLRPNRTMNAAGGINGYQPA